MDKKRWHKPKLIVLVRGRPGESCLQSCKDPSQPSMASVTYTQCNTVFVDGNGDSVGCQAPYCVDFEGS